MHSHRPPIQNTDAQEKRASPGQVNCNFLRNNLNGVGSLFSFIHPCVGASGPSSLLPSLPSCLPFRAVPYSSTFVPSPSPLSLPSLSFPPPLLSGLSYSSTFVPSPSPLVVPSLPSPFPPTPSLPPSIPFILSVYVFGLKRFVFTSLNKYRYWDTVLEMSWPRFTYVVELNVNSVRNTDPQKLGVIDIRPHYVSKTLP